MQVMKKIKNLDDLWNYFSFCMKMSGIGYKNCFYLKNEK